MTEPRSYRGVGADTRVSARRAALIEAYLDALHDDGLAAVSVRSVCSRARLTARYFYESFADLDELHGVVIDSVAALLGSECLAALNAAPNDLHAQARAMADAAYGVVIGDRRKGTAILAAAAGHGPMVARWHRIIAELADLTVASLPALAAKTAAERRAARATAVFLIGGTAELISCVLADTVTLSRRALVERISAMWVAVLTAP